MDKRKVPREANEGRKGVRRRKRSAVDRRRCSSMSQVAGAASHARTHARRSPTHGRLARGSTYAFILKAESVVCRCPPAPEEGRLDAVAQSKVCRTPIHSDAEMLWST